MKHSTSQLSDDIRSVGLFALAFPFIVFWPFLSLAPIISLLGGSLSAARLVGNAAFLATGFWAVAGGLFVLRLLMPTAGRPIPAAVTGRRAGAYAVVWTLLYVAFWSTGSR